MLILVGDKVHNLIVINRVQASSLRFQLVPKGVKVSFEPRTLEKEVINSLHTLFANKASCTFGISEPENTSIKTEIPHDPDLNMEPTDKIWVVIC